MGDYMKKYRNYEKLARQQRLAELKRAGNMDAYRRYSRLYHALSDDRYLGRVLDLNGAVVDAGELLRPEKPIEHEG